MASYSETIKARYSAVEQEPDAFGRMIKVQRLRPWDASVVRKLADSDRGVVINPIIVAACVREIVAEDGTKTLYAPPNSEADIAIVMGVLDEEGLEAAVKAYVRVMGLTVKAGDTAAEGVVDAAKN